MPAGRSRDCIHPRGLIIKPRNGPLTPRLMSVGLRGRLIRFQSRVFLDTLPPLTYVLGVFVGHFMMSFSPQSADVPIIINRVGRLRGGKNG